MKSNIFIPEKINVGFQERSDTYTKKLAYIIYFDEKGVLRKETSWNSWRNEKIQNEIHNNVPTEGFVLNKKAGGYSSGWNHRQTYVRVYDPRGFEFEISVPNLLYILENTNSIRGKGLEGEFVYGWDGKELVLLPVESPDYKEITEFNKLLHSNNKIKIKDLKLGATYLTKSNDEWVYMGKFDYYTTKGEWDEKERKHRYEDVNKGKHHYFVREEKYSWSKSDEKYLKILYLKSLGNKFIDVVSEECNENYLYLMEKLEREPSYSPVDDNKDEYLPYNLIEFKQKFEKAYWEVTFYSKDKEIKKIRFNRRNDISKGLYESYDEEYEDTTTWGRPLTRTRTIKIPFNSIEEIFNKYQPLYLNKYLENGKLYQEGK